MSIPSLQTAGNESGAFSERNPVVFQEGGAGNLTDAFGTAAGFYRVNVRVK